MKSKLTQVIASNNPGRPTREKSVLDSNQMSISKKKKKTSDSLLDEVIDKFEDSRKKKKRKTYTGYSSSVDVLTDVKRDTRKKWDY